VREGQGGGGHMPACHTMLQKPTDPPTLQAHGDS
jgi:hypothetical protein